MTSRPRPMPRSSLPLRAAHELGRRPPRASRPACWPARPCLRGAGRHYERALELWPRVEDAEARAGMDRAEVLRHAAACANARGEESRSVGAHPRGARRARRGGRPAARRRALRAPGHFLRAAGTATSPSPRSTARSRCSARAERPARARARDPRARADAARRVRRRARGRGGRAGGGAGGRRGAHRAARAQHARLRERRPGRGGAGHRYAPGGAAPLPGRGHAGDRVRAAINLAELLDFAGRPAEALDVVRAEAEAAVDRPERSTPPCSCACRRSTC